MSPGLHRIDQVSSHCEMLCKGRTSVDQFLASPKRCMIFCYQRGPIGIGNPVRVGDDGGGRRMVGRQDGHAFQQGYLDFC